MALQIILCMETNKRAATDYIYIRETINRFYEINNKIKISPVYMNTKTRYKSKDVIKEINRLQRDYKIGDTKAIYCIDTDLYESNAEHASDLKSISDFCKENEYDMIWFCHDIEEVYLERRISDKEKVAESGKFRNKNMIQSISENMLSCENIRLRSSNILLVLDKYLKRRD